MSDNLKYFLAVNKIPGIGPTRIKKAMEFFGDIRSFWYAGRSDLLKIDGLNEKLVEAILQARTDINIDDELKRTVNSGYKIITIEDKDYPSNLLNIYDPPPVLYVDGNIMPSDSKAIAIVGTRKPTYYGREMARSIAIELSKLGFTIISGLALGIDSESHLGALDAGGRTISVYGSGIDHVYPPNNINIAKRIRVAGANISEFPLGFTPDKWTFPQRNRIISGLSLGVIVIEGTLDSGALITAKLGLEQGREVFAVPGNVRSEYSKGPHSLIKDGAKLVEGIDDILDELKIYVERNTTVTQKDTSKLNDEEKKLIAAITYEPMTVDNIIYESGLIASDVLRMLSVLEMRSFIKQLPGNNYVLT